MSPETLGTALRDLVDDVEADLAPPVADELWAGGRRRRRTARLVPVVAAACVAAMVTLVVWPSGAPRASMPAVTVDDDGTARLTAYPDVIAKPPSIRTTTTPGVMAALIPGSGDLAPMYAVSPMGALTRVPLPRDEWGIGGPSLSPDGRWVSRGPALTDLVSGRSVPSEAERRRLERAWAPPEHPAWWAPDSSRVFVGTFNQGALGFGGLVIGTDGSTTSVPLVEGGLIPVFAGWLDDGTLLALLDLGPGATRLELRTWTVGDPGWTNDGTVISWLPTDSQEMRASISPDGSRLLVLASEADAATESIQGTNAMMFDPRTGAQLGMPVRDGTVDPSHWAPGSALRWEGWGCRSVWHHGLPVATDGSVRGFVDSDPNGLVDGRATHDLVSVSSGYGQPCVAFAGDELRGTAVTNHVALWQERLWTWGVPLLGLTLLVLALWAYNRRQRTWRKPLRDLPPIITQPF